MTLYPIFLNIKNPLPCHRRREVAERKVLSLLDAKAKVTVKPRDYG